MPFPVGGSLLLLCLLFVVEEDLGCKGTEDVVRSVIDYE